MSTSSRPLRILIQLLQDFHIENDGVSQNPRVAYSLSALVKIKLAMLTAWTDIYMAANRLPGLMAAISPYHYT